MQKNAIEIYNRIVSAPVGATVSLRHDSGKDYSYSIEDMLRENGYENKRDYESIIEFTPRTVEKSIKKLSDIRAYIEPKHSIKVGDVFYYSWGYDQTNIEFFQVVAVTAKTVSIREIRDVETDYNSNQMTGRKDAKKDDFVNDTVLRKTPYCSRGVWYLNMDYGMCAAYDGKPKNFSCYA